jgi:outer membrane protein TolC
MAALAVIWPCAAAAQATNLTLQQAIQDALAHNAALRAVQASSAEAGVRVDEARSALWPKISFSESWQRGNQPVFVFGTLLSARRFAAENFAIDSLNHPDPVGYFHSVLSVEQLLFDGGRQRSTVDAARFQQTIATATTDQTAAGIAAATTAAFGRIVTAQSARRAAESGLASAREDLARAE